MSLVASSFKYNTLQNYKRSWNTFINFLLTKNIPLVFPFAQHHILSFILHLSQNNLKSSSIRSYLSAIAFMHKLYSFPDPTSSYLISRLLKGNENIQKAPTIKLLPITKHLNHALLSNMSNTLPPYETILFSSVFSLSYFFCLRSSEVTSSNTSSHTLSLDDICIDNSNLSKLTISFKSFKHSLEPVSITYKSNGDKHCPLKYLVNFLSVRGNLPGPLFLLENKRPLTRNYYSTVIKQCISNLNQNPARYNTHSFRIGRATDLALKGVPSSFIKSAGRWNSNAYEKYIRPSKIYVN